MSFYKQNSFAKHINELTFIIKLHNNTANIKNKNIKNVITGSNIQYSNNYMINQYVQEITLLDIAINKIFDSTENAFHKYINIKVQCQNVYTNNLLNEWFQKNDSNNFKYYDILKNIHSNINKCKIEVN